MVEVLKLYKVRLNRLEHYFLVAYPVGVIRKDFCVQYAYQYSS